MRSASSINLLCGANSLVCTRGQPISVQFTVRWMSANCACSQWGKRQIEKMIELKIAQGAGRWPTAVSSSNNGRRQMQEIQ